MIIVDTSVWIEFLKRNDDYFGEFRSLMEHQHILAFEPVFAELLQGVKNRREKEIIEQYWNFLPKITIENYWIKAGNFSSELKLLSQGVGLIDSSIIVVALETNSLIWTLDKKLQRVIPSALIYKLV